MTRRLEPLPGLEARRYAKSLADYQARFWKKVGGGGELATCWAWRGSISPDGYGYFFLAGRNVRAHRLSYTWLIEEIPPGLVIDHLCRNRACVNPWHLEPVTRAENTRRGETGLHMRLAAEARETCGRGHLWSPENTYMLPKGGRSCRECQRTKDRRRTRSVQQRARAATRAVERAARRCSVEACEVPYSNKGYCKMHAERVRRNGHPYLQGEAAA